MGTGGTRSQTALGPALAQEEEEAELRQSALGWSAWARGSCGHRAGEAGTCGHAVVTTSCEPCQPVPGVDGRLEGILSKFANSTKFRGPVNFLKVKRDLDKLERWAITNHMKFNEGKCWILHLGQSNPGCEHRLEYERLENSAVERDLGVLVDGKLNKSHCILEARRANPVLGCLRHSIASQTREGIVLVPSALGQPHLKCWGQLGAPQ
ncbi:hypothetical protein TURU_054181 [Turdus rufiventris]|nr:hypothetical protein TURU_054181 [Turdus rufiventris]